MGTFCVHELFVSKVFLCMLVRACVLVCVSCTLVTE